MMWKKALGKFAMGLVAVVLFENIRSGAHLRRPHPLEIVLPTLMLIASVAIFGVLLLDSWRWLGGIWRRRSFCRHKNGLCVKCGYDVRACTVRCAECGWPMESASEEEK